MDSKERRSQLQGKLRERVTRGRCNFTLPKPFVILSSKGLKRNGFKKYVIYPDLSRFKTACLNCPYRKVNDLRSSCAIADKDFRLKFYGITPQKGIMLSLGSVPPDLRPKALGHEAEAYLRRYVQKRTGGRSKRLKK